uniref:Uncharacterized protein n=1 Tax=Anguilla anguilla TaxID=7936 RepID=A0A0E9X175_ANGAN
MAKMFWVKITWRMLNFVLVLKNNIFSLNIIFTSVTNSIMVYFIPHRSWSPYDYSRFSFEKFCKLAKNQEIK